MQSTYLSGNSCVTTADTITKRGAHLVWSYYSRGHSATYCQILLSSHIRLLFKEHPIMLSTKALLFALILGLVVGVGITTESLFISAVAFAAFFYLALTKTDLGSSVWKNTKQPKARKK